MFGNDRGRVGSFAFKGAFPHDHDPPVTFEKFRDIPSIPFPIGTELLPPEFLT